MKRSLAALAIVLATLGLLARTGTVVPPELAVPLAAAGRAATPVAAAVLALATVVGAAALVRGRPRSEAGVSPAVAFRGRAARPPADDLPPAGTDVATALDRLAHQGAGADPVDRETVRDAVERAGVTVLARAQATDRQTARRRFRRGDWTRDPTVAAFCGADVRVPLRTRLSEALAPDPRFVQRARRSVDALATVADGSPGSGDEGVRERDGGGRR